MILLLLKIPLFTHSHLLHNLRWPRPPHGRPKPQPSSPPSTRPQTRHILIEGLHVWFFFFKKYYYYFWPYQARHCETATTNLIINTTCYSIIGIERFLQERKAINRGGLIRPIWKHNTRKIKNHKPKVK